MWGRLCYDNGVKNNGAAAMTIDVRSVRIAQLLLVLAMSAAFIPLLSAIALPLRVGGSDLSLLQWGLLGTVLAIAVMAMWARSLVAPSAQVANYLLIGGVLQMIMLICCWSVVFRYSSGLTLAVFALAWLNAVIYLTYSRGVVRQMIRIESTHRQ